MSEIKITDLDKAVQSILGNYSTGIFAATKKAVEQVSNEVAREIKGHVTFRRRSGDYERAFAIKRQNDALGYASATWYVKAPHYRLTHLLENGHKLRDGRRSRAFPHIAYGAELAARRLPELIKQEMEKQT